ncbi:MAG TPA: SDR family NAD(P)-dependent oxidoreductase [Myxococcota bacterium]|nr:SDR family NAD(P)-dependent oxidoreductase [Myxococcota bacterium]
MRNLAGRVAAVTGAASGLGRALAVALAREGMQVAISDVNEVALAETARQAAAARSGTRITSARVDVADRAAVHAWADRVAAEHGGVHMVVNNAGVGLGATIEQMTYDDLEWLFGINFWGVVHGTKAFLPHLLAAEEGHVVNVSSVFGLIAVPGQGAYNAAKFAVRGYTECLRQELELEGRRVSATCVHPGGVKTNIARSARNRRTELVSSEDLARRFDEIARTTPDAAALAIVRGVQRNARRVLIGADARAIDLLQRLTGSGYQALTVAAARRGLVAP